MKEIDDKKCILDTIHNLSNNKNTHSVFSDVVICCAYALANASNFSQEREDKFNRIIYTVEEEVVTVTIISTKGYYGDK